MDDHVFVCQVRFCCRLIASGEIGEGVGQHEFDAGLRRPLASAYMTRDAAILVKNIAVIRIRML
jgi:hypothetical protein